MFIPFLVLCIAFVMIIYEVNKPGRSWPEIRGWWWRAAFLNSLQAFVVFVAGIGWDRLMLRYQPWSFARFGLTSKAFIGYFTITFIFYWWHRLRHASDFLWRWLHQIHHSPQRLEIVTAFYKHPLELLADSLLSSCILYLLLGLDPLSASYAVLLSALAELFYHWNIKTPYWLGFIFQRPESHCVHHQQNLHARNYSDLPLWDILFGTFYNPKSWNGKCGLGKDAEYRLKEMLCGVDVLKKKQKNKYE